jgi:poly(hydroxyalkanoate) granule-associated protein
MQFIGNIRSGGTGSGGTLMAKKTVGKARSVARSRKGGGDLLDMGQQVWFAGIGALARTQQRGPKLFEELALEGARVVGRARDSAESNTKDAMKGLRRAFGTVGKSVESAREQASATWDQVGRMFETRVHRAIRQLGMPTSDEVVALTRKVKELNAAVEALARRSARKASPGRHARTRRGNGASSRHPAAVPVQAA